MKIPRFQTRQLKHHASYWLSLKTEMHYMGQGEEWREARTGFGEYFTPVHKRVSTVESCQQEGDAYSLTCAVGVSKASNY